ncbi:MAG: alpha/beta hydrolase [Clostridia bacterium]|nr:alpha/beta hydrolase [Clostridia bacterium]MDY5263470.1 alpha/beta hydrolase [Eubacteriales bacterium]MDY5439855.1 alpha/beta hydrolase [Eubacteriales bacterium]
MLFLHGWGQSSEYFNPIADFFSKFCRVTLFDFSGFGRSEEPTRPMTVTDYVNETIKVIKDNDLKDVTVIAHSFGARVAFELANSTSYVKKLVIVDGAGILPKRTLKYYLKVYLYKIKKRLGLSTKNCGSKDYKQLSAVMKKTFVNVVNYDQTKMLKNIKTKTLIVWGEKDKETPLYMAKIMRKNLPNSRLVILEDCSHFSFLEDTYAFINLVRDFIDE